MNERPVPPLLYVLAAIILLEGAFFALCTGYLVIEIFAGSPKSASTAIAIALTAAILLALVLVVGRAALRARPWIRGATVCLSVLQLLVAYSIIVTVAPTLGWVLVVPALGMLVLLFTPAVLRATARPDREDQD